MNRQATCLRPMNPALREVATKGVNYLAKTGKNSCRKPAILIDAEHRRKAAGASSRRRAAVTARATEANATRA
jgi:hypothetical protein